MEKDFYITPDELELRFSHGKGNRKFSFTKMGTEPDIWRKECKAKLSDLLNLDLSVSSDEVTLLRTSLLGEVEINAFRMKIDENFSIPGYLLQPKRAKSNDRAIMAIHGHGTVEPCLGAYDDYHHAFALGLAKNGHIVFCPELRGFGALKNIAAKEVGARLDYWNWGEHMAYSLVTDGMLHAKPLIGETVEDLLRWEKWLVSEMKIKTLDVVGISYGGDLALIYPVFSDRVDRIFASGTLGSFSVIFSRCYNAPAHCIPEILEWMDRSDIAGLNAPRPLGIHYGELDRPSEKNFSASYNDTVMPSLEELKAIYGAFGAEQEVQMLVSEGKSHEMDNEVLIQFLEQSKR